MKKCFLNHVTIFLICSALFSACKKETPVVGIALNKDVLSLEIGNAEMLIATIQPDNATNKNVTWMSSNPAVATVADNGLVTAISKGKATITVVTQESNKIAMCTIFVLSPGSLRIVHWSDPQLGYKVDYQTGLAQLRKSVQLINEISPDALLIAGDMVHFPDSNNYINAFLNILSHVNTCVILLTPGNHDICSPITVESLRRYRSFFGDDLQTMEMKGYSIISVNAALLLGSEEVPPEERSHHTDRVMDALQNAKNKNQPIIIMAHHYQPYLREEHYEIRNLFVEFGTFLWISGHWHIPWRNTYYHPGGTIDILVGESTGANDEGYPLGIRLLTVYSDNRFDWDFIPLY